jgi:pimeloyl-ACP methyl ester carboxylesterase
MSNGEDTGDIESGKFDGKIPYVKVGNGPQRLVYFSGGGAFLTSLDSDPIPRGRGKKKMLTPDHTMYMLGYPRNQPSDVTVEKIADELAQVIRKHLGRSIIIGNSFGGMVAIAFAANYSDLTEKLILTNCAYALSPSYILELQKMIRLGERGRILSMLIRMNDLLVDSWPRAMTNVATILSWPKFRKRMNPISDFINPLRSVISRPDSLKQYLPTIKADTVIIGGTADKAVSEALFRETASLIPNAKLVLMSGFGHEMETEHGEAFRVAFQNSLK